MTKVLSSAEKRRGARRRNGGATGRAPKPGKSLQKTLRSEPYDRIYYWLPLENPAGHRKANRRITQVHHLHKTPPDPVGWFAPGEEQLSTGTIATGRKAHKAHRCHESGTEVIGRQEE
jgi:hypothetical protein